jgi:phosphatidylserine/phosphatidylglycerophosphate/cardiolipin synthase-like enzyme
MSGVKLLDYWSPPDGAGEPVACLATSFTFESDFFSQDCLARFLSLSTISSEGDHISSIAALLEEEDKLSEAQVTVLVDRGSPAEKRNLRWDVLPIHVPGGLLHAKVAVLLWARHTRVILGSANLTTAGYRRQVEAALALDLTEGCAIPRVVINDLVAELRRLVDLAPGPVEGAKARARATVDLLSARAAELDLPPANRGDLRLAIAASRPGVNPLDRLGEVWRGPRPLRATVLSPFWDDRVPAPAVQAINRQLTGRPVNERSTTLLVGIDRLTGVQAPQSLAEQPVAEVCSFEAPDQDQEFRRLHAKVLTYDSDSWTATMIGSSNATSAGYGLNDRLGHYELNLWIGCPANSRTARQMRSLVRTTGPVGVPAHEWQQELDEDERTMPELPLGFERCLIVASRPAAVRMTLRRDLHLPDRWEVRTPAGRALLEADAWIDAGAPGAVEVQLPDEVLPPYLDVTWRTAAGETCRATWPANIDDRGALPPPVELAALPADVLLAALASTRPLPVALEDILRRRERRSSDAAGDVELDPLRRFDSSGLLLARARHYSMALWRLQQRLSRPTTSLDVIAWRLNGAFGPVSLANSVANSAEADASLPGEAHFLLAELALTVGAIDWNAVAPLAPPADVAALVTDALAHIDGLQRALPPPNDPALCAYVQDALEAVQR